MYTPDDFNLDNAPREMVQYVIDNVDNFHERYNHALNRIGILRAPLRLVDYELYNEIDNAMCDFGCDIDTFDINDYDIEEIFG
jgi:hypothetical protein